MGSDVNWVEDDYYQTILTTRFSILREEASSHSIAAEKMGWHGTAALIHAMTERIRRLETDRPV